MKFLYISRRNLLRLQVIGPLTILVLALISMSYATYKASQQSELVETLNQRVMLMRLNYEFKVQVQEWKNLLIRTSNDQEVLDNWSRFLLQEQRTKAIIEDLKNFDTEGELSESIARIDEEHRILGEQYRAGFRIFQNSGYDIRAADQSVAQIDRPLSEWLSKSTGDIQWQAIRESELNNAKLLVTLTVSSLVIVFVGGIITTVSYVRIIYLVKSDKRKQEHLEKLVLQDAVTGLLNREAFEKNLEELCQNQGPGELVHVMFIDLNGLQHINEIFGHIQGDEVLREAAVRIRSAAPQSALCARFGGSSLLMAIEGGSIDSGVMLFTKDLMNELAKGYYFLGAPHYLKVNIGLSHYPTHGRDATSLIKNADLAMYQGRTNQGNHIAAYDEQLSRSAMMFSTQRKELAEALDNDQMQLYMQPIVDIDTGEVNSVEALVRWEHPTRGMISPVHFITVAEESGLIGRLGNWVISQAFKASTEIESSDVCIAINISPRQLYEPGFIAHVEKEFMQYPQLKPSRIEFEVTESIFMPEFRELLSRIKTLGVRISIDDFGTGYSNLRFLTSDHIDKIKIDMSFVRDIHESHQNQQIVGSVFELASNMGLSVVCEGVETFKELDYLKAKVGCNLVQGFLFSAPKPAKSLADQLNEGLSFKVNV